MLEGSPEMSDVEKVHALIKTMYSHHEFKDAATSLLENFQNSIHAWQVSDELLSRKLDYESCYFAAQTLKIKTKDHFNELPPQSIDSLKESIINHLKTMDHKVIKTQLCLSLAYIYFSHPAWTNPIEELATKLSRETFFELITLLVQEFQDLPKPKRRIDMCQYLTDKVPTVMLMLIQHYQQIASNDGEQEFIVLFSCLEAWVGLLRPEHLASIEPLVGVIFVYLQQLGISNDLHEKATDALCKVIFRCETSDSFDPLMNYLNGQILKLEEFYDLAIGFEDSGKILNFARIFSEFGTSNLEALMEGKVDVKLLELIIKCVSYYDFEVAEVTFAFFYNFAEEVYKRSTTKFVSRFNMLLHALTSHCRLEADMVGLVDSNQDQFDNRDQVKCLLEEIVPCTDWVGFFNSINMGLVLANSTWEVTEMYLYILHCIFSNRPALEHNGEKDALIQEVLKYIFTLKPSNHANQAWPQHHLQLYATSCDVLGKLNTWLDGNPTFLEPVIDFLIQIINQSYAKEPKLTAIASLALQELIKLCVKCSLNLQDIANLFTNMLYIIAQLGEIDAKLHISIISCCTTIVSSKKVVESNQQEAMFVQLLQICVSKFDGVGEAKSNPEAFYMSAIDAIYSTFKNFKPNPNTCNSLAVHTMLQEKVWPFIKLALSTFCSDSESRVVEHSSRSVRHIIRSMRPVYLLQPIVDFIVPLYEQYPVNNSPLLYIGAVLVDEFADPGDRDLCNGLVLMLNSFLHSTLSFLSSSELHQHPFTIDDLYNLCYRMLTRMPQPFLANVPALDGILDLLNKSFYLEQKETSETLIKFSLHFLKLDTPVVANYVNGPFGLCFINAIIDACIFKLPSYFMPDLIDPLWAFKTRFSQKFTEAIAYTTTNLAEKAKQANHKVTETDLNKFYTTVIAATNSKRLVTELRALQRLF